LRFSSQAKILLKTTALVSLVHLPTVGAAQSRFNIAEACLAAVSEGDMEEAGGYLAQILDWQQVYGKQSVTAIVSFILSRVWAFRADDIGRFPPAESDGELRTGYLKGPLA
jgi:hypothetical protein